MSLAAHRALGAIDLRSVARDPLLRWMVVLTPAIGLFLRFAAPSLASATEARFGIDLTPYFGLVMSFLPIAVAGMYGTVVGFMLLDQRDDQTMMALLVTPLSIAAHLRYRVLGLLVSCTLISAITLALAGLTPITWLQLVSVSLAASPLAPIYALVLGSFARNKVQGFALVKALGIVAVPCVYAYFVAEPWQQIFGLIPHYWPLKTHWLFDAQRTQAALLHILLGVVSHVILLSLLLRHFKQCIGRGVL